MTQAKPPDPRSGSGRRRAAFVALILTVLMMHAAITRGVIGQMDDMGATAPGIKRMDAVMVADMQLSAPPVVVAPATAPPPVSTTIGPPAAASAASQPASKASSKPAEKHASDALLAETTASAASTAASDALLAAPTPEDPAPDTAALAASAEATVTGNPPPGGAEAFEWPLATRVTFKAEGYIRGPIYGQAQVEWVRQDMHYQVHVDASVGPSFAPLGSQRWTSEGEITAAGLEPRRFESVNKLLISNGTPRRVIFHPQEVELADGRREPKLPLVQDPASHYIQLAYQALLNPGMMKVGGTISMPLAWTRKQDTVVYDIEAREELDTPLGKIDTFKLKPRPLAGQKDKEKEKEEILAEIWVAPSLQYLPIRMLLRQGKMNYLDMRLDRMPQQAGTPRPRDVPPAEK